MLVKVFEPNLYPLHVQAIRILCGSATFSIIKDVSLRELGVVGDYYPQFITEHKHTAKSIWQYEELYPWGAFWSDMSPRYSNEHEKSYQANAGSYEYKVFFHDGSSYHYVVDFTKNTQLNKDTGTVFNIRRIYFFSIVT